MHNVMIFSHFHSTAAEPDNEKAERSNPPAFHKGGGFYNNKRNTINFNYLVAY